MESYKVCRSREVQSSKPTIPSKNFPGGANSPSQIQEQSLSLGHPDAWWKDPREETEWKQRGSTERWRQVAEAELYF